MRQHGTITSLNHNKHYGQITADTGDVIIFPFENVLLHRELTIGQGVTFIVRVNTAYDGAGDTAAQIVADGTLLPHRDDTRSEREQAEAKRRERLALAIARTSNSADRNWRAKMGYGS